MTKKIKLLLLLSSVFVVIYCSSCTPDNVIQPNCDVLYPENGGIIDSSVFYFQWCEVEGATKYRVQAEGTTPFLYDTIVESNSAKSIILLPILNDPSMMWEWSPFKWGETYEWRVAPIINGVQGDWSETYHFKTWDERDKYVGTYTGDKYIYKHSLFGEFYLAENLGTGQVKVEKVEGSNRKIRITEIGGNHLTKELDNYGELSYWSKIYNVYPNSATFYEQSDSFDFEFMTNPADSLAWGYYFGGHY